MGQNYSPDLVREWSHYLRTVANKLNGSLEDSENRLAEYFYDVHYAIGPEYLTESDIFALDKEYLELVAEQGGKTPEKVMRELIESIGVVICEGDKLRPEIMSQSVWNSGLRNYLCKLKGYLECRLAQSKTKRSEMARGSCFVAALILSFLTGVFYSSKEIYEPKILLVLGCLLAAILLTFFSLRKEKK